jgi:phosphopantetheinyl transferase
VFPAEITVRNDPSGRPVAAGAHGRRLPPLALSLAHRGEAAVALVGAGSGPAPGVGIDIEEVAGRGEASAAFALGEGERALLAERCANSGESPQLWVTRFWAAKEAVAKAEGTGLRGRPKDFAVTAAGPAELAVAVRGRRYRVRSACVTEGGRQYVVAWTTSPSEDEETNE